MAWKLRKVPECGTSRGYDYHTRHLAEKPCNACRNAKRLHWRTKREANRERLNAWRRQNRKTKTRYEKDSSMRRKGQFVGDYSHALVVELYGLVCHVCQTAIDPNAPRQVGRPGWEQGLHIDHVIPISKNGPDTLSNVRPAHAYCNQLKGAQC